MILIASDISEEDLSKKGIHLNPSVGSKKYIESYKYSNI